MKRTSRKANVRFPPKPTPNHTWQLSSVRLWWLPAPAAKICKWPYQVSCSRSGRFCCAHSRSTIGQQTDEFLRAAAALSAADRVPAVDDPVDHRGHRLVHVKIASRRRNGMRRSRVLEDADDFSFGKHVAVIQCQKQRLADGKSSDSSNVGKISHRSSTFFLISVMLGAAPW